MCKSVKCPQCGHEFTPERVINSGAWTEKEDEQLLHGYQKDVKRLQTLRTSLTVHRTQRATVYISSVAEASLKA